MTSILTRTTLSATMAATLLVGLTATPAMAQGHGRGHDDGTAIVAGIFGVALGALIASSVSDHHREEVAYVGSHDRPGMAWRDGYYWDHDGHRFDRDGRPCDDDAGYARRGYAPAYRDGAYHDGAYRDGGYRQAYRDNGSYRDNDSPRYAPTHGYGWRQGY